MKKLFQKIGAVILLGVFCIYITPRDCLHHFVGHEDTQDETCRTAATSGLALSTQHQHCEWLHWAVEAYVDAPATGLPSAPYVYETLMQELPAHTYQYPPYYFSLRAPPHVSV